jgi:hypothetical protein
MGTFYALLGVPEAVLPDNWCSKASAFDEMATHGRSRASIISLTLWEEPRNFSKSRTFLLLFGTGKLEVAACLTCCYHPLAYKKDHVIFPKPHSPSLLWERPQNNLFKSKTTYPTRETPEWVFPQV